MSQTNLTRTLTRMSQAMQSGSEVFISIISGSLRLFYGAGWDDVEV